jgi:arylsulfatase A-like enzyme
MSQPNALLIVLDAVRKDHLSCYGHDRETSPNLDAFAADATRYDRAIAPGPWTPPSHASMFTGQYPSEHGVYSGRPTLAPAGPTVAELLARAGYTTVGFSNSHHTSTEHDFDRGFDYYHDILDLPRVGGRMYEPSLDYLDYALRWLLFDDDDSYFQLRKLKRKIRGGDRPFFGFINLNTAHSPYDPPDRHNGFLQEFDRWDEVDEETVGSLVENGGYEFMLDRLSVTDAEWELVERTYDCEIRYMDTLLGSFFDFLRETGRYDDTLIVVTADHGEHFGEHGMAYHQFSLFEELLNVPLLVKQPGQRSGGVADELRSLVDVAPTVLKAAAEDPPDRMQGRPLQVEEGHEAVFAEYGGPYPPLRDRWGSYDGFERYDRGLQAVRTDEYKLIVGTDGERALYDVTDGERPIADGAVADELQATLEATLGSLPTERRHDVVDRHVEAHLERMGYR